MRNEDTGTGPNNDRIIRRKHRLSRFAPVFRDRIAALTCCAPEAEDLVDSFPALLVAFVTDFATASERQKAFRLILDGQSVKAAAQTLRLPLWLKKMPPEAFRTPLRHLPSEAQFTGKVSNFIPQKSAIASDWLEQVSLADENCGSSFALWVAKHCGSVTSSRRRLLFLHLASWAWHGDHPETIGHGLIQTPWSAKMGIRRAGEELMRWRRRVDLACLLGDGIESSWLEPGTMGPYEFVALRTLEDFISESEAMNNCLDQYADRLATGLIRVFSIRQSGKRVADLEIGPMSSEGGPSIIQIKAAHNRQAPPMVWQATQHWLQNQPLSRLPRRPGPVRSDGFHHAAFWKPYLDWLPQARREQFEQCLFTGRSRSERPRLAHPIIAPETHAIASVRAHSPGN